MSAQDEGRRPTHRSPAADWGRNSLIPGGAHKKALSFWRRLWLVHIHGWINDWLGYAMVAVVMIVVVAALFVLGYSMATSCAAQQIKSQVLPPFQDASSPSCE